MNKNERKHDLSKSSKIGSEDVGSFDIKMVEIYDQEFYPQATRTINIHKSVRPTMFLRP